MADPSTSEEKQRALAARLRELRTAGFEHLPLNRKELGRLLGDVMKRPAGPYAARRVGDFENPVAKSPPPIEALRGYAQLFGRTTAPPYATQPSPGEVETTKALELELLVLRDGLDARWQGDAPIALVPAVSRRGRRRRAIAAGALLAAIALGTGVVLVVGRPGRSARQTFCVRNTEIQPSPGAVGIVCARDIRLRPFPGAPSDEALGTVEAGEQFLIDRYTPTGTWVHGTPRLKGENGRAGWIEAGWFCPSGSARSTATACATTKT